MPTSRTFWTFERAFLAAAVFFVLALWITPAWPGSEGEKVFSKRRDLPLLESDTPSAKAVARAAWNEELSVVERKGRWLKVSAADGQGWVYLGSVAPEKLPEENKNDLPIKASGLTASAAGRGLSAGAAAYAERHDLGKVAEQVNWAETLNTKITEDDARAYLREHKLGEFAEAAKEP